MVVRGGNTLFIKPIMQYPLNIRFKTLALAPQVTITDADKNVIAFIRQKFFKFREHVEVFTDKSRSSLLADIKTNKIIDWSARYTFTDDQGNELGAVGRKGMRSLWKATYCVFEAGGTQEVKFHIEEENPLAKIFDSLLGEIPVLGFLTAVLFQPRYVATREGSNEKVMRLTKKAAFFEGRFTIDKLRDLTSTEELNLMLSLQMLTLLERARG